MSKRKDPKPLEKPTEEPKAELPMMATTETIQEPTPSLQARMIEWARKQPLGATFTMEEAAKIFNVSVEEFRANFMILRQVDQKLDGLLVYPR